MKYTIASLIAYLSANEANAQRRYGGYWGHYYHNFHQIKQARCHYTEDYYDWYKPRMLIELNQIGPDEDPQKFELKLQAYSMGMNGEYLTVNSFKGEECKGESTPVADGSVLV